MKKILVLLLLLGVGFFSMRTQYAHRLAVCAIFKNEANWLKEWIVYHHDVLGVDHFYLYNNGSDDHYMNVLAPYIASGVVDLFDWGSDDPSHCLPSEDPAPWSSAQLGAYNDCLKNRALKKAKWVAMIDIDEFIVPVHGVKSFYRYLRYAEKKRKGTIKIPWRIFGTSNVQSLGEDLLTERLTKRAVDSDYSHNWAKSIHRPEGVEYCHVHDAVAMAPHFRRIMTEADEIRIHHYWTRDEAHCLERRKSKDFDGYNQIEDKTILQYIPVLRQALL